MSALEPGRVVGKRVKCLPPRGRENRWCHVLETVLSTEATRGLFTYDALNFKKGTMRCLGVATRIGGVARGKPVLLNVCPWCGERIDFFAKEQRKAAVDIVTGGGR